MTTSYTVGSNSTIELFQYEPFSYTWTYPGASRFSTVSSTNVAPFVFSDASGVVFSSLIGAVTTSSSETLTIRAFQDLSASILLATSSNAVTIGKARFVDDVSQSLSNRRFTFYKNEPIEPTAFSSFYPLASTPITTVTLPAGIGFVSNSTTRYTLSGTPLVQIPSSNYTVIGSNGSQYIQCPIVVGVNAERMVLDLSGTGIVSGMQVGTAITPQTFTARCPPYPRVGSNLGNYRYTWTQLPLGLEFADVNGVSVGSSPFKPLDASGILTLRGTPTLAGAQQFADLRISQATINVTATRISQSPFVTASQDITVSFAETILFTSLSPTFQFFTGVPLDPSANFVEAQTYFAGSNVAITSITAPGGLPPGLSLNFVPGTPARAYFTGTPTTASTGSYTLRATNPTKTQDVTASISVVTDTVGITGPVDVCYNFVLSRPASSALTGYYPTPITWSATAASGLPVTFSAPALAGTGLVLDASGSSATLTGLPDTLTSLRNLRVTASAVGSPATASRDVSFAVIDDVFTFTPSLPAQTFVQNKAITPIQAVATTLSERFVVNWSSTGLPDGLKLSSDGILSGTATESQVPAAPATLVASTGYSSASSNLSVQVLPDDVLIASVNGIDPVGPTFSNIDIRGVSYSGGAALLQLNSASLLPYQGGPDISLSITPTGMLSGDFTTANRPFPAYSIAVSATVGSLVATERLFFQLSNTPIPYHAVLAETSPPTPAITTPSYAPPTSTFNVWINSNYAYKAVGALNTAQFDLAISNFTNPSPSNANVAYYGDLGRSATTMILGAGSNLYRSTNGGLNWAEIVTPSNIQGPAITVPNPPGPPSTYVFPKPLVLALATDGTSNWVCLCAGSTVNRDPVTVVRTSSNDGLTWTDTSLALFTRTPTTPALDQDAAKTRLFYNNGRYFLTQQYTSGSNAPLYSAFASSVTLPWVEATGVMSNGTALGMAFSNNLALVVGTNSNENIYRSTDNGTNWSQVVDARFNGSSPVVSAAGFGDGQFVIAVNDFGMSTNDAWLYQSTDTSNWTRNGNPLGSPVNSNVGLVYDDNAWLVGSTDPGTWNVSRMQTDLSDNVQFAVPIPSGYSLKRMLFHPVSRGTVSGTVQIVRPSLSNLIEFVEPTQTSYTFYQYCSNAPIVGRVSQTTPDFVYYYASGLPDGLTAAIDGSAITVTGKSVTYSDAPSRTAFFARQGTDTVSTSFTTRTILPFTVRDTVTPASAFTSLTRQYTVVNAARNAENRSVYPAETRTIGEFTRPYPPDETTQTVDPKCYSTSNCP